MNINKIYELIEKYPNILLHIDIIDLIKLLWSPDYFFIMPTKPLGLASGPIVFKDGEELKTD